MFYVTDKEINKYWDNYTFSDSLSSNFDKK